MFKFITFNSLKPRSFKFNKILYDTKVQIEGIPQGNVVIPIFFILKIKNIVAQLSNDNRYQISLYMDDLQMSYLHPSLKVVERMLQDIINIVEEFAQKNGFKFSTSKTFM